MKDNKLIAEFMGFTKDSKDLYLIDDYSLRGEDEYQATYVSEMKFHTSWDWMMPVVEKIEMECEGVPEQLMHISLFSTKAEVHKAVLEFINEYNKHNL